MRGTKGIDKQSLRDDCRECRQQLVLPDNGRLKHHLSVERIIMPEQLSPNSMSPLLTTFRPSDHPRIVLVYTNYAQE